MRDEHSLGMDRRSFLASAAGVGTVLAMPIAHASVAEPDRGSARKSVAIVDSRFDDALRAASVLPACRLIDLEDRPDAYRTWRESLRSCRYDEVYGVTTWSDYALLKSCLEHTGYRAAHERIVRGRVTLVNWSLRRQ